MLDPHLAAQYLPGTIAVFPRQKLHVKCEVRQTGSGLSEVIRDIVKAHLRPLEEYELSLGGKPMYSEDLSRVIGNIHYQYGRFNPSFEGPVKFLNPKKSGWRKLN